MGLKLNIGERLTSNASNNDFNSTNRSKLKEYDSWSDSNSYRYHKSVKNQKQNDTYNKVHRFKQPLACKNNIFKQSNQSDAKSSARLGHSDWSHVVPMIQEPQFNESDDGFDK